MTKANKRWNLFFWMAVLVMCEIHPASAREYEAIMGRDLYYQPVLVLGKDLDDEEREQVLSMLELSSDEMDAYLTIEITNQEEQNYLMDYLSADEIRARAVSAVTVEKMEQGYGVQVFTTNISSCSEGMYCNSFETAGIKDSRIRIAAPYDMPGMAAFISVLKAYQMMTGQDITYQHLEAAVNELMITRQISENTGEEQKTVELIELVKQKVLELGDRINGLKQITIILEDAAEVLNFTLTEEEKKVIVEFMLKIKDLDLEGDFISGQGQLLYQDLDVKELESKGFLAKVIDFFLNIWKAMIHFISKILKC